MQRSQNRLLCFVFLSLAFSGAVHADSPFVIHAAKVARRLVARSGWAVISTISSRLGGAPYGNVQSLSDGLPGLSTGVPYFYLSMLDATPQDLSADSRASLTLSAAALGEEACRRTDPENPTCARVTLTGNIVLVPEGEKEVARTALFTKHPFMKKWPERDHKFHFYKMIISNITVIDFYGPAKIPSVEEYFAVKEPNTVSA